MSRDVNDKIDKFKAMVDSMSLTERETLDINLMVSAPEKVIPGTADEFIYGCLTEESGTLEFCVPSCINGYKPSGMAKCELTIYQRRDGKITCINNKKSDKAYLYISQDDPETLTKREIDRIHNKDKVNELYIYKQSNEGVRHEHIDTLILSHKKQSQNTSAGFVIFLFIVFILLIIITIFAFYNIMKLNITQSNKIH